MIAGLIMLAKLATPGLFKITVFLKRDFDDMWPCKNFFSRELISKMWNGELRSRPGLVWEIEK